MRSTHRLTVLFLLILGTILLTGCPQRESISKIMADPGRYRNKEVGVTGTVTDSYGILGQGTYELDDGTGRIWVATRRGVPSRGSHVGAKGRIISGGSYGGRNYGTVLEETARKAVD
ncbi:MAG: hypothetical protein QOJ64_4407 [Acidobacteriota bacterium]|jgi:hypothetical protein|nr:hypothetical protein [Acidobacteriota bacterium]